MRTTQWRTTRPWERSCSPGLIERVFHDAPHSTPERIGFVPSVLHLFSQIRRLHAVRTVEHVLALFAQALELVQQFPLVALNRTRHVPGIVLRPGPAVEN